MSDTTQQPRTIKPPSYMDAAAPILALILLVVLAQVLFEGDLTSGPFQIALIVCALFAATIAFKNGHDLKDLGKHAVDGISSAMGAIFILLAVGALIGTWSMAGTTATLTYYGVKFINPTWFYLTCVIICALISISIGSSWTTVGTIGVALIAISEVLGLNPAITAGAVISGGYFGDKMSPLSDTTNLAPAIAGTDLYTHIRAMLWTTIPSIVIALALFAFLGFRSEVDTSAFDPNAGAGRARSDIQHLDMDAVASGACARHGTQAHPGVCGDHVGRIVRWHSRRHLAAAAGAGFRQRPDPQPGVGDAERRVVGAGDRL